MGVPEAPLEKKEASVREIGNEEEEKTEEGDIDVDSDVDIDIDADIDVPAAPAASSEPRASAPPEDLDAEPKVKEDPIILPAPSSSKDAPSSRDPPTTDASTSPPPPTLEDIQRDFEAADTSPIIQQRAAAARQEGTTTAPRARSTPKWVWFGFCILLLVVISMLGVVVSLLRDNDNDNDDDDGSRGVDNLEDGGGSSDLESDQPSFRPSLTPSFAPTPTPNGFQSIANAPGAQRLTTVSSCDDCEEEWIMPQLAFLFGGDTQVSAITISSNGFLDLECTSPFGVTNTCASIAAAAGDLDPSVRNGANVWILEQYSGTSTTTTTTTTATTKQMGDVVNTKQQIIAATSMVISWEGVPIFGVRNTTLDAQITLFADDTGTIEICWGRAVLNDRTFSSGIRDYDRGTFEPAKGPEFDSEGVNYPGEWPTNRCQRFFDQESTYTTPRPVDRPTSFPSATYAPNYRPIEGYTGIGYTGIAGIRGARRLDYISDCDDCSENVELPFRFLWLGRYAVASMSVSANGFILFDRCRVDYGGGCFQVDVASADLNPSLLFDASIWTYDSYSESGGVGPFVVSWENVPFDGSNVSYLQAQAHIYRNGTIDICWGAALPFRTIRAGIGELYTGRYFPATVYPFDESGRTIPGTWPAYQCQRFNISESDTPEPTEYPYGYPSEYPYDYPSENPYYSMPPYYEPPTAPTTSPLSYTTSPLSYSSFSSLIPVPGTVRLNTVSSCDDCEERVELPFTFYWLGRHAFSRIYVSSNGQITIDESNCYSSNSYRCGRIAVISGDLYPTTSGSIRFLGEYVGPDISFKVSWESIALYGNRNANISASARVFVNGTIELCWGVTANLGETSLLAGIFDSTRSVFAPADGWPFDENGSFSARNGPGYLPTNLCQRFLATSVCDQNDDNLFCVNNGRCKPDPVEGCECPPGYTGFKCEFRIDNPDIDRPSPTPSTNYPSYDYPSTYYPSYDYPSGQPAFDDGSCRDSAGSCATNFVQLRSRIASARYSETISICGSFTVPSTLSISQGNVTLCCASSWECTLSASSAVAQRILFVDGDNVSLRFITFRGGASLGESGGNVAIVGRGDHQIVGCIFFYGFSDQFGGNLFVKNADSCHISRSDFHGGNAVYGGGAAFEDTVLVNIEDTIFENNTGYGGGGVFVSLAELTLCTSVRQVTSFSSVAFDWNYAQYGAGFMQSSLGTMPQLIVENSLFTFNDGGAGVVLQYAYDFILQLSNNEGVGNIDRSGQCDDFAFLDESEMYFLCFAVDEDFRLPIQSTLSPAPTQSPTLSVAPR